jgi:hypothetical protein
MVGFITRMKAEGWEARRKNEGGRKGKTSMYPKQVEGQTKEDGVPAGTPHFILALLTAR